MNEASINQQATKKAVITSLSSDIQTVNEISEEFSLPDYVPEVRRVLHTDVSVLPEGKFISDMGTNTSLDFNGTVTYNVVYTDDEGKLRSVPLSSAYEGKAMLPEGVDTVFIDTGVDSISCRVNAPRRLTVKTRLKSRILSFTDGEITENIHPRSASDEIYLERRTKHINTVCLKPVFMQNIRISDKLDTREGATLTPIMCDAKALITECKARTGVIAVRGNVSVRCLCNDGENDIMLTKSLPMYEELEAEGALPTDLVRCASRCVSLSVSNEQNTDTSRLFFDVTCEIEGEFYRNEENTVTADCYSTKYETEATYKDISTYSLVSAKSFSFPVSDKFKRKEGAIEEIVEIMWDTVPDKIEYKNNKAIFTGKVALAVIGKTKESEGKSAEYLCESYEVPFTWEEACPSDDCVARISYDTALRDARYENDKFCVDMEIYPSLMLLEKSKEEILDAAEIHKDKEYVTDSACVRVFFPKDCDILWEVAKKYHTSQRKIVEDNGLDAYSLENVKSIII